MHAVVGAAKSLQPLIRERADEAEGQRRLTGDVVAALRDADLFRMCVPAAYGGPEVDPLTMMEAIATVAHADGAAGWCSMIASTTSTMSCFLAPDIARKIYEDPMTVTGGAFAPNGVGKRADGGYVVNGRWQWGSGTDHCQWLTTGTLTDDGGFHLFFVPAEQIVFHDTWYSNGLRGTSSWDFEVRDVFVPDGYSVQPLAARGQVDSPLARFPNFSLLACGVASAMLGIARRAIDEIIELANVKTPVLARKKLGDWAMAQVEIARAEATLSAARAFLRDEVGQAWETVLAGEKPSVDQRIRIRLACSHVGRATAEAVDRCYDTGGGSSVYATSPLQRCFRDIHTATAHIMVGQRMFETYGKHALGHELDYGMI
jgi:indole-3-acetate monooxygenase